MAGTSGRRTGQGRKSPEARAVIEAGPGLVRPAPPANFGKAECAIWQRIVSAVPADWFQAECQPLLARLCFLIVMTEQQEAKLRACGFKFANKEEAHSYFDACKQVVSISTRLRLTPQARFNRHEAGSRMRNRTTSHHLWDDEDLNKPKLRVVKGDD